MPRLSLTFPRLNSPAIIWACSLFLCLPLHAAEPQAGNPISGIAFVGGPVIDRQRDEYKGAYHWRDGYVYPKGATYNADERTSSVPRPGRNLFALVPATADGTLTQLTFLKNGEVYDPEPSPDGQKLLFAMRPDGDEWFHLYEIGIDGSGLKQLTAGPFNDISGVYLPDGKIVFCSDRTGVLDEYHEERSEFLFRMEKDGSEIEQITFNPGIYFEPTVLQNGLILCSFWDAFHISVPPFLKHETYLITLKADGTEERPFFGAGEYQYLNRTRHSAVGLTKPQEMSDGRILLQSEWGPAICDPDLGVHFKSALAPVFPGTTSVQTGGTTHVVHVSPLGTRTTPYPLQDGRFLLAATLPGSRDLGIYVADPNTRAVQKIFDRPNLSEWDPVPIGVKRPVPTALPDTLRDDSQPFAKYVVVATQRSDSPEREKLNERARYVRVLQSDYTTVTTSSHTSLETRILGTAPIQPDGSIAFEAPADTPLFLETMDARGNRLVLQAGHMSARAGEVKSCMGCHAPATQATDNSTLLALRLPFPRITRDASDLSYRRNDPEEYRRGPIVTQSALYRPLLRNPSAELRRQGLEQLASLPDEVTTSDRSRFAELLQDEDVEVRRQAGLTLAITGTVEAVPSLIDALNDRDPHVVHYAAMALESITGENLSLLTRKDANVVATWKNWWHESGGLKQVIKKFTARGSKLEDEFARDAWLTAVSRTAWIGDVSLKDSLQAEQGSWLKVIRGGLAKEPPEVPFVVAAGLLRDAESVKLIEPWLVRGMKVQKHDTVPDSDEALAHEVRSTKLAQGAALALGRIGIPEAVAILWQKVAETVPVTSPGGTRHYQTGPRPEEYTYLRGLILAGAKPEMKHVPFLIGLLPYTEGEKPRFEDRTHVDSQRIWLPRILLERAGLRKQVVDLAGKILQSKADPNDSLYQQVLSGMNIDRPRSEHGRVFPHLEKLADEQALALLSAFAVTREEISEPLVAEALHAKSHRERIEAAVTFRRLGFSPETVPHLVQEIRTPYGFSEMSSIGKGRPDTRFRDKSYLMMALAAHVPEVALLQEFTDSEKYFRDIRIGLALGLGFRGEPDGVPLLQVLSKDPIFSVNRLANDALGEIREQELLQGRSPREMELTAYTPLLKKYSPPFKTVEFADKTPEPLAAEGLVKLDLQKPDVLITALHAAVDSRGYQNASNSFVRLADRMRITDSVELAKVLDRPEVCRTALTPELKAALTAAVQSELPFANYLSLRIIMLRGEKEWEPVLVETLAAKERQGSPIAVTWICEALGVVGTEKALPALRELAQPRSYSNTWGSIGLPYGFAAARAIGRITRSVEEPLTAELLRSDNQWLKGGVLDGLSEGRASQAVQILSRVRGEPGVSAFLQEEAKLGLRRLSRGS